MWCVCVHTHTRARACTRTRTRKHTHKYIHTGGRDLPKMDRFGKSDPYVVLELEGTKFTTSVKKRTLNPIWRETFTLNIADSNATLRVTAYDWDFAEAPDLMGSFGVDVQDLIDAGIVEQFYTLRDEEGAPVQVCVCMCVYT
jgi:Ca2+-dependent lipid-binding protein